MEGDVMQLWRKVEARTSKITNTPLATAAAAPVATLALVVTTTDEPHPADHVVYTPPPRPAPAPGPGPGEDALALVAKYQERRREKDNMGGTFNADLVRGMAGPIELMDVWATLPLLTVPISSQAAWGMRLGVLAWTESVADVTATAPAVPPGRRSQSSSPTPPPSPRQRRRRPPSLAVALPVPGPQPPPPPRPPSPPEVKEVRPAVKADEKAPTLPPSPPKSPPPPATGDRAPLVRSRGIGLGGKSLVGMSPPPRVLVLRDHDWRGHGTSEVKAGTLLSTRVLLTPFFLALCRHAILFNSYNALRSRCRNEELAPALAGGDLADRLRNASPAAWPHELLGCGHGELSDCALAVAVQLVLLFCYPAAAADAGDRTPLVLYEALRGEPSDEMNILLKRVVALSTRSAGSVRAPPPLLELNVATAREMLRAATAATVAHKLQPRSAASISFFEVEEEDAMVIKKEEQEEEEEEEEKDVQPDAMDKYEGLGPLNEKVLREAVVRYRAKSWADWLRLFASRHALLLYSIRHRPTADEVYEVVADFLDQHVEHVGRTPGGDNYFHVSEEHVWLALSHLLAAIVRDSDEAPNDVDLQNFFGHHSRRNH